MVDEKDNFKSSKTRLKAEWFYDHGLRLCSNCGNVLSDVDDSGDYIVANFCNKCGAKMSDEKYLLRINPT